MFSRSRSEIILGALLASAFWAAVLGWQASYAPTEKEKQECQEAAQKSGHKTEECKTIWERTTSDPIAFFTFVLSISTIGLWVVTWRSGVRQSRDMEAAIAVAQAANRISRENMIHSRRAWVTVENVNLLWPTEFTEEHVRFRIQATAKNIGETPASSVWIEFGPAFLGTREKFVDIEHAFKDGLWAHWAQVGQLLSPKDEFTLAEDRLFRSDDIKDAIQVRKDGTKYFNLTVLVGISYRIVGDDKAHIVCHLHDRLNIPLGTIVQKGQTMDLPRTPFHASEAD